MDTVRMVLGGGRMLVGLSGWTAPDHAVRVFGIAPERSDRFVTRLFASRDFALALALLTAPPAHLRTIAAAGAAIDAVDAVAGIAEYRRGSLSTYAFVVGGVGAMVFAAMGAAVAGKASPDA
ncbi:hypothetical protein DSM112329_04690 [Paraconexibacter sp. AEG42_29]|uniref:Uncharacterized protein n=1 Tax=Paraconexibacter sp. AEG42_29 TaxID=2997339 RepID=A0AAU7B1K2_9ACTN